MRACVLHGRQASMSLKRRRCFLTAMRYCLLELAPQMKMTPPFIISLGWEETVLRKSRCGEDHR